MKENAAAPNFKLVPVVAKGMLNKIDEAKEDIQYWLTRPAQERLAAVTFLVLQSLADGECIDKTMVSKKRLKHI
ncbi:MAG: hypothetical protein K9G49_07520 [Taibaiella sp.]|nr:hypothetical protein [Taibaiella sp.]